MTNVFLFCAVFLCGMMLITSGAPLSTDCKIPSDLNIHYKKLTEATIGNKVLRLAENILSSADEIVHRGGTSCPKILPTRGETQDRASCPWYLNTIADSTMYPPFRSEAVCRCRHCFGFNRTRICEVVYSEMFFLNRTSVCVDGLVVYEPIIKRIPTGCTCDKPLIP